MEITAESLGLTDRQDREVRGLLAQWERERRRLAEAELRQMAAEGAERRMLGLNGDLGGEVKMQIHPTSYHYWGARLGYQCWSDPGFCREYLRDVPESRIRSHAPQLTLRVPGLGTVAGGRRYKKTYTTQTN